uniref:Heterokaryon incompatibility domain-containing protein n=1 Tax=Guillardia theta TaxID=55529 RepID=A0A7S4PFZ5_GUITH|mmetsp:Transcript_50049/g.156636  ORF Transcript_50049/g.156636 Transcript_50049/m.156636 type:complete len:833 (+) Transcript_50049:239-2737(+)
MQCSNIIVDFLNVVTLRRATFIFIARTLACFKVLSLAYFVFWSYSSGRCFRHLTGTVGVVVLAPLIFCLLLFGVEVLFWMYSLARRMFTRMFVQSQLDANRNLLALCTPQLCMAQKKRIRELNTLTDLGILLWLLVVVGIYFEIQNSQAATNCQYRQDYGSGYDGVTSCVICSLQPLIGAYACFLGVSVGIILKTVVLASKGDFTLQSRVLENILLNKSSVNNVFWAWVSCSELRQLYSSCLAGLLFLPALALVAGVFEVVPADLQPVLAPIVLALTGVILLIDGGILYLPVRIFSSLFASGEPFISRDVVSMISRPRRKVVASFLWFLSVPWIGGCQLADLGALGGINHFAAALLVICVILTVFLFLVRDREMSVEEVLKRETVDHFGLILSKTRLVAEFSRILEESKDGPPVVEHGVRIPTYLASQDRIDLSAVISYRWSDETMYKKMSPDAQAPRCYKIRLLDNEGFDWTVTMVEPMLEGMVQALDGRSQEYVWMDQFSIPQVNPAGSQEHERVKEAHRNALIPRMIGLFSSGGIVVAFNNTGDSRILEQDWYERRLWCVQEYSFPESIVIQDISNRGGGGREEEISMKRKRFNQLWFRLTERIRSSQVVDEREEGKALKILLDWDHTSSNFPGDVQLRVSKIGAEDYLANARKLSASNRNDVLPALAQAWFGIIMTREETKLQLVVSIIRAFFETSGELLLDVILNQEAAAGVLPSSGTMCVDRMLADFPAGLEKGEAQRVQILGVQTTQERQDGQADLHVFTGRLVSPAGFEEWRTSLQCIREATSVEEGGKKFRLLKMTVSAQHPSEPRIGAEELNTVELHEFECL